MKLVKPYYKITTEINGEHILRDVEKAARTCYKSEGKIEYGGEDYDGMPGNIKFIAKSARVLIPKLLARGHEAMFEFGGMVTVLFCCDRGVSHELVRHRVASFAQESTRYCNYGKDANVQFIIPNWLNIEEGEYNWSNYQSIGEYTTNVGCMRWANIMLEAEVQYNKLIELGWAPQQARSILPNSLKTEINVSANIREWRHIFKLRTSGAAHPQMQELMRPLLDDFKAQIPILFDDITY